MTPYERKKIITIKKKTRKTSFLIRITRILHLSIIFVSRASLVKYIRTGKYGRIIARSRPGVKLSADSRVNIYFRPRLLVDRDATPRALMTRGLRTVGRSFFLSLFLYMYEICMKPTV